MDGGVRSVDLRDGRSLGYAEYGRPGAWPVFYFHGSSGSRIGWPALDPHDSAAEVHARLSKSIVREWVAPRVAYAR
jgi:hypothetical protein